MQQPQMFLYTLNELQNGLFLSAFFFFFFFFKSDICLSLQLTAAAPISLVTLEFFLSLGIPIYEVYGMSECTGPQTVSIPGV